MPTVIQRLRTRLASEPRPARFVISRLLWKSGLCRYFTAERRGYRVRFFPSAVSAFAWVYPSEEPPEERFVASVLAPGDAFVDVGANVGLLSLRAAAVVGPAGRVISIEAHPRTSDFLRRNVALNGFRQVQVLATAVGERAGTLTFQDRSSDDQNSVDPTGSGPIEVPVESLDVLLPPERVERVALLKIDVEGFELWALRGATRLLERTDRVLIESWTEHAARFGYQVEEVFALLTGAGFTLHRFAEGALRPLEDGWRPTRCENVVGLRA